jgi:hypothetical protein
MILSELTDKRLEATSTPEATYDDMLNALQRTSPREDAYSLIDFPPARPNLDQSTLSRVFCFIIELSMARNAEHNSGI